MVDTIVDATLALTKGGSNDEDHDWNDVLTPLQELETWANTTKLSYVNVQDGIRPAKILANVGPVLGRTKVRNATGGTLTAGTLVYMDNTYTDGSSNYPSVAKATASNSGFRHANYVVETDIGNNQDGVVAMVLEITGVNTSGATTGDPVYLSTTAGAWKRSE